MVAEAARMGGGGRGGRIYQSPCCTIPASSSPKEKLKQHSVATQKLEEAWVGIVARFFRDTKKGLVGCMLNHHRLEHSLDCLDQRSTNWSQLLWAKVYPAQMAFIIPSGSYCNALQCAPTVMQASHACPDIWEHSLLG